MRFRQQVEASVFNGGHAGRADGMRDGQSLRDGARTAIVLSVCFGILMVVMFLAQAQGIIGLFLDLGNASSAAIVEFGAKLLAVAALFQLADAMQGMALGLLRGIKDTRVPMVVAAFSYWLIGIPAGYWLAFHAGFGGVGLWLGLVIGLMIAASAMMWRFWNRAVRV